ncbi:MAG: tRNA uridine-5-carboxymethylaminomethyl(34) synthesis GTPase MnmE [Myxococcales bacterium]|nr:tRNA uridine-5-carboxymethylaminomethyl(34) synthesis GTPase MnmE [Myxococcales bacterium]
MSPQAGATIVGVATGSTDGGVAIIRLSGPQALAIARSKVGEKLPPPRYLGRRRLALEGGTIEDALVVQMPAPRSFTGEDVVELHVHGGARNVQEIVDALLRAGARAAGPGEFSRRAFDNGRLSLDQAEGIAALVSAQTRAAVEQARRLIAGELADEVEGIASAVAELRTEVEANLDFVEDVGAGDERRWADELADHERTLAGWLGRFEAGRRARERARVVLAGPPNAGKSSLFNALLGTARAIVAAQPGTTRDYVEAGLDLGGVEVTLIDTAGLRGVAGDAVEDAGIERSREQIGGGDLILWVEAADAEDEPERAQAGEVFFVENKRDLGARRAAWLGVSVATGEGLDALRRRLREWSGGDRQEPWIGLARHRDRVAEANAALNSAMTQLRGGEPLELIAFELAIAERRLAEISGRSALGALGEDVLGRIFSRFCIGK